MKINTFRVKGLRIQHAKRLIILDKIYTFYYNYRAIAVQILVDNVALDVTQRLHLMHKGQLKTKDANPCRT